MSWRLPLRTGPLVATLRLRCGRALRQVRRGGVAAATEAPDRTRAAKGLSSVPSRVLAYALRTVEWPPTRQRSRRAIRFARLELEVGNALHTGVLIATFRCAAPARVWIVQKFKKRTKLGDDHSALRKTGRLF